MLSSVRISSESETVDLFIGRPDRSYNLVNIDGLGPPTADINYSDYTILDGAVYHNSKSQTRNIVITAEFQPDYSSNESVKDLRRKLYRAALPKTQVRVYLYDDGINGLWIDGYVETHEPSIFSKNPEVQISILATEPYFNDQQLSYDFNQQESFIIENPGDVETGFELTFYVHQDTEWVDFVNQSHSQEPRLRVRSAGIQLEEGHRIVVNTSLGKKDSVLRDGSNRWVRRLLGETTLFQGWPVLSPGRNLLRMNAEGAGTSIASGRLTYYPKYGGF